MSVCAHMDCVHLLEAGGDKTMPEYGRVCWYSNFEQCAC